MNLYQASNQPLQVFNYDDLMARIGGDTQLVNELLAIYLKDAPDLIQKIKASIEAMDYSTIATDAHSLKGASANMGAEQVRQACEQIEYVGNHQQPDNLHQAFDELNQAYLAFETLSSIAPL